MSNHLAEPISAAAEMNPVRRPAVRLPVWRHRPVPRPIPRDHRVMLVLAVVCGLSALSGFLLERGGAIGSLVVVTFAVAYFAGGWFAIQDVSHSLRRGKIDIHFLMIAVALGALAVRAWTEGATLL